MATGYCEECGTEMPYERLKSVKISASWTKVVCDSCWIGVIPDEKEVKDGKMLVMGECEDCGVVTPIAELNRVRISEHCVKDICSWCLKWDEENEKLSGKPQGSIHNGTTVSKPTSSDRSIKLPEGKAIGIGDLRELLSDI